MLGQYLLWSITEVELWQRQCQHGAQASQQNVHQNWLARLCPDALQTEASIPCRSASRNLTHSRHCAGTMQCWRETWKTDGRRQRRFSRPLQVQKKLLQPQLRPAVPWRLRFKRRRSMQESLGGETIYSAHPEKGNAQKQVAQPSSARPGPAQPSPAH